MGGLGRLSLQWAGLVMLWLLFVYQLTLAEVLVGAAASAVTVLAFQTALRSIPLCFEPRFLWLAAVWRMPGMIARDMWALTKDLCRRMFADRHSRSVLVICPFETNGDECSASAQRTLAVLFVTMTPNSVALDVNRDNGEMLIHFLIPAQVPKIVGELQD